VRTRAHSHVCLRLSAYTHARPCSTCARREKMNRLPCATIGCSLLPDLALGVEAVVVRLIIGTMVGTQIRNKDNGIETDLIKIQDQMRIKEQGSTQISGVQSSAQHGPRALFRFQGLCFLSLFQRAVRCSLLAYLAVSSTKSCSVVKNYHEEL